MALVVVAGVTFLACTIAAEAPTPVGTWTTIDDHTHEPRSLVEISERDGALSGRIVRLFQKPGEDANPLLTTVAAWMITAAIIALNLALVAGVLGLF